MYSLFEDIMLRKPIKEAAPGAINPNQPPPPAGAPPANPPSDLGPGSEPPDFTGGGGGADPNAAAPGGTPNPMDSNAMGGAAPQGDPNQDPNAMGGDPNAQMDPNQAMGQMDQMQDPTTQSPESEIDQDEATIFSDLKPEQMVLKNTELKQRYQELYKAVTDTLTKINKVSRTSYDDNMIDFIVKKLTNLRTMITDSLVNAYPARTYLENKVELEKMIYSFNYITKMITNIYESRIKRQQAIAKMNNRVAPGKDPEEFPIFSRGYELQ